MVDTRDLKSLGHYGCTSSSLVSGTSLLLDFQQEGFFVPSRLPSVSLCAHPYEGELSCVIVGFFSKVVCFFSKVVCFLGRLLLELVSPLRCNTKTKAIPSG